MPKTYHQTKRKPKLGVCNNLDAERQYDELEQCGLSLSYCWQPLRLEVQY